MATLAELWPKWVQNRTETSSNCRMWIECKEFGFTTLLLKSVQNRFCLWIVRVFKCKSWLSGVWCRSYGIWVSLYKKLSHSKPSDFIQGKRSGDGANHFIWSFKLLFSCQWAKNWVYKWWWGGGGHKCFWDYGIWYNRRVCRGLVKSWESCLRSIIFGQNVCWWICEFRTGLWSRIHTWFWNHQVWNWRRGDQRPRPQW